MPATAGSVSNPQCHTVQVKPPTPPHLSQPPSCAGLGRRGCHGAEDTCGPSLSFFPFLLPSFYFRGKGGSERLCHFPKLPQRGSEGCRSKA